MKQFLQQRNTLMALAIVAILTIGTAVYFKSNNPIPSDFNQPEGTSSAGLKNYTSQDVKISFKYPRGWFLDDRYQKVLITNYKTNLNRDDKPSKNQIEIILNEFSNCFKTLDEDMINPACGEGGPSKKNIITSKAIREVRGGLFYRYSITTYNNTNLIYYFIHKGDRNLRISKQPDPSQFEKEFEELINSIEFL